MPKLKEKGMGNGSGKVLISVEYPPKNRNGYLTRIEVLSRSKLQAGGVPLKMLVRLYRLVSMDSEEPCLQDLGEGSREISEVCELVLDSKLRAWTSRDQRWFFPAGRALTS